MGAVSFELTVVARDAAEGYKQAVDDALYMDGQDPYNGTISTTDDFQQVVLPRGVKVEQFIELCWQIHDLGVDAIARPPVRRAFKTDYDKAAHERDKRLYRLWSRLDYTDQQRVRTGAAFRKWELCTCVELTGKAAVEAKKRAGKAVTASRSSATTPKLKTCRPSSRRRRSTTAAAKTATTPTSATSSCRCLSTRTRWRSRAGSEPDMGLDIAECGTEGHTFVARRDRASNVDASDDQIFSPTHREESETVPFSVANGEGSKRKRGRIMETAFEYDSRCMDCVQQNPHYTEEHWRNIAGLGAPPQGGIVYVQAKPEGHGLAVASLVLAIVGVVFGLIPITFVVAWACGAAAFVLGVIADRKLKRQGAGRNMAVIGAMFGLLAVALGIVGYVVVQNSLHHLQDQLGS